jgi:4-amino-4-deoxy-L-arabinose transferase-like glycosyltransferase
MMAASFAIFGVSDWAARLPIALSAVLLCWVTARFGAWAFGRRAGMCAGIALATCVGLFLFTRVLIADVVLTLAVTVAMWGLLRATDEEEAHPARWALAMWAAIGCGLLLKGLIAAVFPIAAGLLYLGLTRQLRRRRTWRRVMPAPGILLLLLIAAPWHVLASLRNPPYWDFTMHSERGAYHGFFWFYFINEHVLRFLNLRYPRDYNTVPRGLFWLLHLLWLFPWSVYFPAVLNLSYRQPDRASRTRLMALCWCGVVLGFFTLSTTQEYYSMPCYPALALLVGCALAGQDAWLRRGTRALAVGLSLAALASAGILCLVRGAPTPGDISTALRQQDAQAYTLSLAHMADLTLGAFAYLRWPLAMAGCAALLGAIGSWRRQEGAPVAALAAMMVLFFQGARMALVAFDPYLSSRALAEALLKAPPGELIVDDQYYTFSSVFFYSNRRALLLNGQVNNLEYGSYAPDAPRGVFLSDAEFRQRWRSPARYYLTLEGPQAPRFERLVGKDTLHIAAASGGKLLVTNW